MASAMSRRPSIAQSLLCGCVGGLSTMVIMLACFKWLPLLFGGPYHALKSILFGLVWGYLSAQVFIKLVSWKRRETNIPNQPLHWRVAHRAMGVRTGLRRDSSGDPGDDPNPPAA